MARAAGESVSPGDEHGADADSRLREAVAAAIDASPLSRVQVADKLSRMVGHHVGEATVDAWLAASKDRHRIPAAYIPALCRLLGTLRPLEVLADLAGAHVVDHRTRLLAERAELDRRIAKARRDAKQIDRVLEGGW